MAAIIKKGIIFIAFLGSLWLVIKMPFLVVSPIHTLTPSVYLIVAWLLLGLYLIAQPRQPFKQSPLATGWVWFHVASVGAFAVGSVLWSVYCTAILSSITCEQTSESKVVRHYCTTTFGFEVIDLRYESAPGLPFMWHVE